MASRYKAFISYSHAADGRLAPALQRGIQRLGKPWYRRPVIRLFRDETSLTADPGLWSSIVRNLEQCAYFLLLASVRSADSPWVRKEVAWWIANRSLQQLLIVVTDGALAWDDKVHDFDWQRTNCLVPELRDCYREEPLYVDLRWVTTNKDLSLRDPRFRSAVLSLAAPLHGCPMEELDGDDIRQQKRLRTTAFVTAGVVGALTVALFAVMRAERDQAAKGTSRSIAAKSLQALDTRQDIDQAIQLAVLAWRVAQTDEALAAVKRVTASSSDVARILGVHTVEQIDALAFRPTSAASPELASGGMDGAILFWKIPEGTQASMPLRSNQSRVQHIWFSGDGSHLLSQGSVKNSEDGYDDNLVLFDLSTGQGRVVARDVSKGQGHLEAESVALSADGGLIAFCIRAEIVVWDANADRMLKKFTGKRVEALGGRFIGTSRLAFIWGLYDYPRALQAGEIDLPSWSIHLGRPITANAVDAMNSAAAFSANGGSLLLAGFNSGGLAFYRVGDDSTLLPRAMPPAAQQKNDIRFHIAFDAKGDRVIVGGGNKILAWDTAASEVLKEVRVPISTDVPVAISPDGRWGASVDHAKIVLWDLDHAGAQLPGHTVNASCSIDGDASRACVRMLCEKVSRSLDEKGIVQLLGLADARNLGIDLLKSPCP
jgi:hypothetical protein